MRSTKWISLWVAICAILIVVPFATTQSEEGPTVSAIKERGQLICGIDGGLFGFSFRTEEFLPYEGIDVDICKAIATAILGDANVIEYIELEADERPRALLSGQVDMISRNTTWTLTRDNSWQAVFGPTIFYDGQGVLVKTVADISSSGDLAGKRICVTKGTTSALNMVEWANANDVNINLIEVDGDTQGVANEFFNGDCDALTSDRSQLASLLADRYNQQPAEATASLYEIINFTLSKEPLGPLSLQSDEQFAQIIRWTVYGLIQAEESGITSENVLELQSNSRDATIQNLLGVSDANLGSVLGLDDDFMVKVIQAVGNYGEIYERHFGADTLLTIPRGQNNLWRNGGLLYAPPFR